MDNVLVHRILIDTGASCDIIYSGLFKTLKLTEKNLSPYVGSELYGFNGSSTKPWGYVDLLVKFGEGEARKSVKIPFLVVDCASLYNCIIGRTGLAELGAACSTAHLKLKYHTKDNVVATLHGDIEAARRCFLQENKSQNAIARAQQLPKAAGQSSGGTLDANTVDLDSRFSKADNQERKREDKDPLNKKISRPTPDGESELVPFGDDPTKCFKIGT